MIYYGILDLGGIIVKCIQTRCARYQCSYNLYFLEKLEICFHNPSLWTWVKVYPTRDNNAILKIESNGWYVRHIFLNIIEVTKH